MKARIISFSEVKDTIREVVTELDRRPLNEEPAIYWRLLPLGGLILVLGSKVSMDKQIPAQWWGFILDLFKD